MSKVAVRRVKLTSGSNRVLSPRRTCKVVLLEFSLPAGYLLPTAYPYRLARLLHTMERPLGKAKDALPGGGASSQLTPFYSLRYKYRKTGVRRFQYHLVPVPLRE